ncbi:MAG: hypothetical protein FGM58_06565 [Acidimicrobiia bacterium]|nr:hypothetical protein [Acidimicrobiia bacterium]
MTTAWRSRIVLSGLALCAFVLSLVVGNVFFENLSMNNDEAVYVLQAQMFAGGDVNLSDAAHGDAFRPWMSGRVDGDRLVLVAQPILPGLMALSDLLFGTMRVALAAVAAAAVVAVYAATRTLLGRDPVALVAAGCFVLSPLVMVQSAMYVSYVLAVAIGATALTFVTRGVDAAMGGRRWPWWIIGGGLAEGLLLFTRPLEGIVTGFLLVGWMWLRGGRWRLLLRTVPVLGLSALPVLVAVFTYNAFTTGDPFTFALWAIGGNDSFGFGYRAIAEYSRYIYVGPGEAWLALRTNLRAYPHWIVGGLVSIPLAAWGARCLWPTQRKVLVLLLTMLVAFPFAYFFYYGNYLIIAGRNFYGPHYYLQLLLPSMILIAVALCDLATRRWPWLTVAIVAMVAGMSIEIPDRVRANQRVRDAMELELAAVRSSVEGPAIVIIPAGDDGPYVLHPRGAFANPPHLDSDVLYAADLGGRNLELAARFPARALYRFEVLTDAEGTGPHVDPLRVVQSPTLRFGFTAPAVDQVVLGDSVVRCATGAGTVTITIAGRTAEVAGCAATPTSLTLASDSTVLRVSTSRRAAEGRSAAGNRPVDQVDLVYDIGPGSSPTLLATYSPPEYWAPIGGNGEYLPIGATLAPWLDTSVTAGGSAG